MVEQLKFSSKYLFARMSPLKYWKEENKLENEHHQFMNFTQTYDMSFQIITLNEFLATE